VIAVLLGAWHALPSLVYAFHALVANEGLFAAIDLQLRLRETNTWWEGTNVYRSTGHAVYPPAAYLVFRPLFVFTEFEDVRKVWALWSLLLVGLTCWTFQRVTGLVSWQGRLFAATLPLWLLALKSAFGTGQISLLCVVAAVGAILMFCREDAGWGWDLLATGLFIVALLKPTMTAPFFWLVCFMPGRWRPAVLVVVSYVVLTLVSAQLVPDPDVFVLIAQWTDRAVEGARHGALDGGNVNVQSALGLSHFADHGPLLSLLMVGGLGAWTAGRPKTDPWVLFGVAGIVGRLAFYHRGYDDLLVLPALIAMIRLAARPPSERIGRLALGLLVVTCLAMVSRVAWLPGDQDLIAWVCWSACGALLVFAPPPLPVGESTEPEV